MNKLFTKAAKILVGLSLAAGVGVAVGSKKAEKVNASDISITFPGSPSGYTNSYTGSFTITSNSKTYTFAGFNNGSKAADNWTEIRGARKNTAWSGSIATPKIESKVKTVSVNITQKPSVTTTTSMTVASDSSFNTVIETVNVSLTATGELKYHVTSPAQNQYYRLNFSVGSDNTSNGTLRISSFDITYQTDAPSVAVTGVQLNKSSTSITVGSSETLTATISPNDATNTDVTWTSSDESAATVSGGVVTAKDVGSTTITVTTDDGSFTDTCTVTTTLPSFTTQTVSEALTTISGMSNNETSSGYYKVQGFVTGIKNPYANGFINFYLGNTADTTIANSLTCYKVYCSAAIAEQILAGAEVSLIGKYEKYVSGQNTTLEMVDSLPSQVTIISSGSEPETYAITFADAVTLIDGLTNRTPTYDYYTVQGYVKTINEAYDNTKITFEIAANSSGTDTIKVYHLNLSAADAAKVEVGATIEVTGNLELYDSTRELINGKDFDLISAPVVQTYTVTYADGGAESGNVPTDSNSPYNSGATVTVLGNTGNLTKDGYTFAGWSDGSTTYQAGGTFTINGNTTLTAQWTPVEQASNPPYSADFTTVETHSYTQNKEFTLNSKSWISSVSQVNGGVFYLGTNSTNPNPAKGILNDNSTFADVVTVLAANDAKYNTEKATAHAYALLFEHAYNGVKTITFDWNGGNNAFQVYLFGDSGNGFALLAHEDYATSGTAVSGSVTWTNSSGTTNFTKLAVVARPGTSSTVATSKALRAHSFTISASASATYTISYDANGGEGNMSATTGAAPQVAACTFTYDGYTFERWNSQANGEGTDYAVGTTLSQDITLYAIWEINGSDPTSASSYFFLLDDVNDVTTGTYVIAVNTGSYYGMDRTTLSSGKYSFGSTGLSLTNSNRIGPDNIGNFVYEIEKTQSGTLKILNPESEKYVKYTSSSNVGEDTASYEWTISSGTKGTFRLTSETSGRVLAARASTYNKFGGYSSNNITAAGTEYYDIELFRAYTASDFASELVDNTTCNVNGTAAPTFTTGYGWSVFESNYTNMLSTAQKTILHDAQYTKTGSGAQTSIQPGSGVSQTIANCVAKYDYIVGKYNPTLDSSNTYKDFMNRQPSSVGGARLILGNVMGENSNTVAIIIVISMVSVTAIGGYFFLKKRREQN